MRTFVRGCGRPAASMMSSSSRSDCARVYRGPSVSSAWTRGPPRPRTNVRIAGWEVDAVWPAQRVALEVDGALTHGHRLAVERDHRRDLDVQAAGYRTVRVTYRQLTEEPLHVVARLARLLD
jgi:hypothetical protein